MTTLVAPITRPQVALFDPAAIREALAGVEAAQGALREAHGLLNACLGDAQAGKADSRTACELEQAHWILLARACPGVDLAREWAMKALDPEWPEPISIAAVLPAAA